MKRRFASLVIFILILIPASSYYGCSSDSDTASNLDGALPMLEIGDTWVHKDTYKNNSLTISWEVTWEVIGEDVIEGIDCYIVQATSSYKLDPPAIVAVSKTTMDRVKMEIIEDIDNEPLVSILSYSYLDSTPRYPYELGKTWKSIEVEETNETYMGQTTIDKQERTYTYKVEQIEEITVPAGTFECFVTVKYDKDMSPVATSWRCPEVKLISVKYVDNEVSETRELLSYCISHAGSVTCGGDANQVTSIPTQPPAATPPLTPIPSATPTDEMVTFPDPNLEAAIREAIGKPDGKICPLELESLTKLEIESYQGVNDLTGLEYCINLESLYLAFQNVRDISLLANLTELKTLDLNWNVVTDLSPLSNLLNLEKLVLRGNQIRDLTPLSGLNKLQELEVGYNNISSVASISGLVNLDKLGLEHNQISDLSPLANLDSLRQLYVLWNRVTDISSLANLTNLTYVSLSENAIEDISPLANLTKIETLHLSGNQISDISALGNLANIKSLWLNDNEIDDVYPISDLLRLDSLSLGDNEITDISPLATLDNISKLYLNNTHLSDITPLFKMSNLQCLELNNNEISDLEGITELAKLRQLSLKSNQITDISPLYGLSKLHHLTLSNNNITDISGLTELEHLILLWISGNPLNEESVNTVIPQLEKQNVTVFLTGIDLDDSTKDSQTHNISGQTV